MAGKRGDQLLCPRSRDYDKVDFVLPFVAFVGPLGFFSLFYKFTLLRSGKGTQEKTHTKRKRYMGISEISWVPVTCSCCLTPLSKKKRKEGRIQNKKGDRAFQLSYLVVI